ncbi:response regulator transcription factor [Maricaulis sp.]|uniref:response regulator n=1 Tax=Maricaulis sp. TaxID=1486257 RepID=UPI00261FB923|nr:response regulator transcription factor [Maricaulis sp.]
MTTPALSDAGILLIDDSQAVRSVLSTLLRGLGVQRIYQCGEADEALVLAHTCRPDIVLVDYDLGACSGLDVIRSFRDPQASPDPDLPVLLLGPLELPFLFEGAREAGASAILPKPLNANTLGQSLMTVLAARRARPEILSASGLH